MTLTVQQIHAATDQHGKYFPLGDRLTSAELDALELKREQPEFGGDVFCRTATAGLRVMGVKTHVYRHPRKGEWYLSGAIATAYRAPNDFTGNQQFLICQLAVVSVTIAPVVKVERCLPVLPVKQGQ